MASQKNASSDATITINVVNPYNFALTLSAIRSFEPTHQHPDDRLHLATRILGTPTLIEVGSSVEHEDKLIVSSAPESDSIQLRRIVEWVLFVELDLAPFYRLTDENQKLKSIIQRLHGLKPIRPISLFEMAVVAITEQQISLAAAYQIRSRIIQRFGEPIWNHGFSLNLLP